MRRAAALDLGSNSFHLLVADVHSHLPAVGARPWIDRLETAKTTLRLAAPVAETGALGPAAERALTAAADLVATARRAGAADIVTVATSALRDATDGPALLARLRDEVGIDACVVDGFGEGALSLVGMRAALQVPDGHPAVGLDLGGGSFEVVASEGGPLTAAASLPLGVGRLAFAHDPPWLAERAALYEDARSQLADVAGKIAALYGPGPLTIGTAGTIRDIGRLALALATGRAPKKVGGLAVTREQVERACARLASEPVEERADLPGVSRSRADLLPAGSVVLLAALDTLGVAALHICHWGVREGALLDALGGGQVVGEGALRPL